MKIKRPSLKKKPNASRKDLKRTLRKAKRSKKKSKNTAKEKARRARHEKRIQALNTEKPKLRDFQKAGVEFIEQSDFRCLLADSQGTGKTVQALYAIGKNAIKVCPVLVICPSSVVWNWEKEAFKWLRHKLRCHVIEGMSDPFPAQLPHITVVSWDLLCHRVDDLCRYKWGMIVADEIHYAKNADAKRTQAIHKILETSQTEKILIMSGTPLVNNAEEYQAVKDIAGGDPPVLRRVLEDVAPEIPPKTRLYLPVTMPNDLQQEYEQAVVEFGDWLDEYLTQVYGDPIVVSDRIDSTMKAENLIKMGYLRRIVARGKIPSACAWTYNMVKKKKQPVVVFGEHQDILDLYTEGLRKLKIPLVRLDGKTGRLERQQAIDNFMAGKVDVFLGSRSAFEGITLVRSTNAMFLERFYTPSAEEQAEDRIRRIGQTKPTHIWYLTATNTIDERIEEIVERKRRIIARIVGQPEIATQHLTTVLDNWDRLKPLNSLSKPLKIEPSISAPVPKTPASKFLRGVLFNAENWSLPQIQRALRKRKHQIKDVEIKGAYTFIQTKPAENFIRSTIKKIEIAHEFFIVVGKPATNSKRVSNYRK
jgi:SNF2 family DNA or RNA helicase